MEGRKNNYLSLTQNCKRGSIVDALPLLLLLFVFGISSVLSYAIYDGMRDNGFFTLLGSSASFVEADADRAYTALDWMSGLLFVGAAMASLLGALLIRSHPAFFFISIFVLIIEIVISVAFSNAFDMLISSPQMSGAASNFTILSWLLGNLPFIVLGVVILLAVVIYAVNPFGN